MEKIDSVQIPRAEVNKLIMNYLVTEGFKDAAEKFQVESGTEPGIDLQTLDQRIRILEAIQCGDIQEAVEMINSYQPELLDDNRYLFFHLQQQHLIELVSFYIFTNCRISYLLTSFLVFLNAEC